MVNISQTSSMDGDESIAALVILSVFFFVPLATQLLILIIGYVQYLNKNWDSIVKKIKTGKKEIIHEAMPPSLDFTMFVVRTPTRSLSVILAFLASFAIVIASRPNINIWQTNTDSTLDCSGYTTTLMVSIFIYFACIYYDFYAPFFPILVFWKNSFRPKPEKEEFKQACHTYTVTYIFYVFIGIILSYIITSIVGNKTYVTILADCKQTAYVTSTMYVVFYCVLLVNLLLAGVLFYILLAILNNWFSTKVTNQKLTQNGGLDTDPTWYLFFMKQTWCSFWLVFSFDLFTTLIWMAILFHYIITFYIGNPVQPLVWHVLGDFALALPIVYRVVMYMSAAFNTTKWEQHKDWCVLSADEVADICWEEWAETNSEHVGLTQYDDFRVSGLEASDDETEGSKEIFSKQITVKPKRGTPVDTGEHTNKKYHIQR
jgi:hypothetical protein